MKLLIVTQIVDINDDVLGFMHGWIEEFSKKCEKVIVVCLKKGKDKLPNNVMVLSLEKENGRSKIKYLLNFYKYIWRERKNYDAVFVHMNQEYVLLGAPIWKLLGKKIGLWYAHGYVPFSLKITEKLTNIIFTSTVSGCRVKSNKIKVVGQGIDVNKFKIQNSKLKTDDIFRIITVGRISPSKDYETLILAAEILKNSGLMFNIEIIGGPAVETDKVYFEQLKKQVNDKNLNNTVKFIGPVANKDINQCLQSADLFVNMGQTGSLDKAVLEAMASGLPVLTCNEALLEVFGSYKDLLMYPKQDYNLLAEKIRYIYNLPEEQYKKISADLRQIVIENHSLNRLIKKILNLYEKI